MASQIFPIIFENSKEYFLFHNRVKSQSIYVIVILAIIASLVLLPLINISLSIQGRGFIRPIAEKTEIKVLQPELVYSINIIEGQSVQKGDTLITLRQDIINNKLEFLRKEVLKQQTFINDLNGLVSEYVVMPTSVLYRSQFDLSQQRLNELEIKISKAIAEIDRNKSLFKKEIISVKAFDDLQFVLDQLEKEKDVYISNRIALWESDFEKYTSSVNDYSKQILELEKQKQFYIIISPVSGTVEEFSGIYIGSMLQSGQTIAVISPESDKIAEVYVSAQTIGYLSKGQKTKIQVDAFNYNLWGSLHGYITDISDDFIFVDNVPVFNVKCKLDKDYLELKNGIKGNLKKGMTINVRFMITKRSLFQFLYLNSDDLFNPSRNLASK